MHSRGAPPAPVGITDACAENGLPVDEGGEVRSTSVHEAVL